MHLQLSDCLKIIENIKKSGSKYLMASTSSTIEENAETSCIILKFRNLFTKPFNFPEPIKFIFDKKNKFGGDHIMGIWEIDEL